MNTEGLSAKLICFELARLIAGRFGIPSEEFTAPHEFDNGFVMYAPGFGGGVQVAVKNIPTTFSLSVGHWTAEVIQGAADRFLTLDAYSARFLQPAAAVLYNSVMEKDTGTRMVQ